MTDANLVLGRYDSARFAGGTMALDAAAARAALDAHVGRVIGVDADAAAGAVVEMVDETMANAARIHAIESGKAFAGRTVIAFGGGGPVHACRVAEKIGAVRILVPRGAGVGSAIGFLRAPIGYEVVRSLYGRLGSLDVGAVNALLDDMAAEALAVVEPGRFGAPVQTVRTAFMRYVGQGHEIPVRLPPGALAADAAGGIRSAFDCEYARFYNRPVPGSDVEVMSFAVAVATVPVDQDDPSPSLPRQAGAKRVQAVRDPVTGAIADWPVHDRAALAPGARVAGPAIIAEDETSTLVGAAWSAAVDARGMIILTREPV